MHHSTRTAAIPQLKGATPNEFKPGVRLTAALPPPPQPRTTRHRPGLAPTGEPRRACFKLPEPQAKRAKHDPGWRTGCAPDRPAVKSASCGVQTHAQLPAVDLKSTPLTSRANWRRRGQLPLNAKQH